MNAKLRFVWLICLGSFWTASQASAVPPRTVAIKLKNDTDKTLFLVKQALVHGGYTPKLRPPAMIKPGQQGYWKTESNELGTNGTAGNIRYRMGDGAGAPEVYISWNNPFISSQYGNTYHQFCPEHFALSFTGGHGNHAEADFLLTKTRLHSVAGFKPSTHAFHFSNNAWKAKKIKLPVVEVEILKKKIDISNTTEGMCGGMTYAVIDYFVAKKQIPQTTEPPSREADPLFQYLKNRLMASWDVTGRGADYFLYMQPEYPDGDEGVLQAAGKAKGRSFVVAREEWPKIKADIDANRLCPLGLVQVRSLNLLEIGKNHQVLAYAYELDNNNVTLHIYDPNETRDDTVQLKFNVGDWAKRVDIHRFVRGKSAPHAINTLFRTTYSAPRASLKRP